ncbi:MULTISPECIES: FGGY-family carbohydrate kinase [Micromonospora]|uniref:Xylulokinase n=1 Tax=Micromonospora yangpuensis TaxID=683228 RepID=A0A1C6V420_9ACTN|nr:FGGY-family carbohydrate kinase [Micromonospora yangpuensis]GGM15604.1 sugar kinase [Micromonospora yangpuensis]SCL61093.1 xylulokinase [Micromonospora yangpuensis]
MTAPLLIGIDLGTGSSKGVLTDAAGQVLATAVRHRPRSMSMPHPGWAEVDAEAVWWGDVTAIAAELTAAAQDAPVAAVCVSGVGPCLVLCDEQDNPVRPAILYGVDMRATEEIAELTDRYGADEVLRRTGTPITSQAVGPKALWVRRREPQVWDRATRWYNSSSYVVRKLTGEYVLDHHTASQSVPLYDLEARRWHQPWYDEIMAGLPAPRLAWSAEVVGTVTPAAAEATGLPVGTPVCAGTVDAWAESVSVGVRAPGDLMLMYGSTMFFVQQLAAVARHPQLWNTAGVAPDTYCLAAGMATSGSLTGWLRELVGDVPFETLVAEAARVPAGSDGLLLLPYFAGERSPIFDPDARGVIAGLTLRHGRGHLFRAVYEGIAYGIRQILELLDTPANPVQRLVAVGGGTQGGLWTKIVSDVTGREQEVPAVTIGASYGDALLAAIGAGLVAPDTDWTRPGEIVRPDPSTATTYDPLYAAYTALYHSTRPQIHHLATLQGRAPC